MIWFYLGKTITGALTASAKSPGEVCEAVFYTAEWNIIHAQAKAARDQVAQAVKICPVNYNEAHVARAELAALAQ